MIVTLVVRRTGRQHAQRMRRAVPRFILDRRAESAPDGELQERVVVRVTRGSLRPIHGVTQSVGSQLEPSRETPAHSGWSCLNHGLWLVEDAVRRDRRLDSCTRLKGTSHSATFENVRERSRTVENVRGGCPGQAVTGRLNRYKTLGGPAANL